MAHQPVLSQVNLVVRDIQASVAFYRRLELAVEAEAGAQHVAAHLPGGLLIEWDSTDFVTQWDSGWSGRTGGSAVLGFSVPTREAVDQIYADLTHAGCRGRQPPYDAFWGARYAIVDDPDGNGAGLMSPVDADRTYWPPRELPASGDS